MYRTSIKHLGLLAMILFAGIFIACQKEDDAVSLASTTDYEIEERSGGSIAGCYDLVFPVTIQFADSTTATVNSEEELKQAIRDWFAANGGHPRPGNRPMLVFPFQVVNLAGEVITVETPEQFRELKALCRPDHTGPIGPGGLGHHLLSNKCYTVVYPVTIIFADSSAVTVNSPEGYREAIQTWIENNPGQPARPQLVFPVTVTLRDGSQVVVNSSEELKEIADSCRRPGNPGNHDGHGLCFTIVFPVTLVFPDGSEVSVNSHQEVQAAIRAWHQNNPGQPARPEYVYPITVTLRDGTQVVVNSAEELKALKEDCRG
jgi:hypothetical protein